MEFIVTLAILAVIASFAFVKIFQQQQVDQNKVALAEISSEVDKPIQQGELLGVLHPGNFQDYLVKYLNPMQTCSDSSNPSQGCAGQPALGNGIYLSKLLTTLAKGKAGDILASGASVYGVTDGCDKVFGNSSTCCTLVYDANASKGPNRISQDIMTCDYAISQDCTSNAYPWLTVKAGSKLCSDDSHPNPTCDGNRLKGTWDNSSYQCICPGTTIIDPQLPVGGGCKCKYGGQVPNGSGTDCNCPGGQQLVNGTCQCIGGQKWDGSKCSCPGGQSWNGGQCYCSGGRQLISGTCQCPSGTTWNGSQCQSSGGGGGGGSSCNSWCGGYCASDAGCRAKYRNSIYSWGAPSYIGNCQCMVPSFTGGNCDEQGHCYHILPLSGGGYHCTSGMCGNHCASDIGCIEKYPNSNYSWGAPTYLGNCQCLVPNYGSGGNCDSDRHCYHIKPLT